MFILEASDFNINLEDYYDNDKFILKDAQPINEYVDNKKTDKVIGYKYKLVDPESYDTFYVKVKDTTPVIPLEKLSKVNKTIVTLDRAMINPYEIAYGKAKCTIVANAINIVEE